jgi:uncharacterized protein YggT (Ycf19 family)
MHSKQMQTTRHGLTAGYVIAWGTGAIEALLLARLLARLLAARPDNPAVQALYWLTDLLVFPLRWLDAQQPQFGAVFELSTLAMALLVPLLGFALWRLMTPYHKGAIHG